MPSGGHNKKSATEHWLRGDKPAPAPQESAVAAGRPKFPKGMGLEAKRVFKRLVGQLTVRRTCTEGDMQVLHLYAELHVRWVKARRKVDELGEVVTDTRLDSNGTAHEVLRKNPWLTVAQESEKQMHNILRDLGLTPNARTKVKPTTDPQQPVPVSPEEAFFNRLDQPRATQPAPDLADFDMPEVKQ